LIIKSLRLKASPYRKQIEALTATVQKVSDQLELNKTARQVAVNDQ
jgi:hypothetical protein